MSTAVETDYRAIYHLDALNTLGKNITVWRENKGFYSTGKIEGPILADELAQVSHADLMLSKLMLMSCEIAEAAEAVRKGDMENFTEELADCVIRILDTCGAADIDIASAIYEKMAKNHARPYRHGKTT